MCLEPKIILSYSFDDIRFSGGKKLSFALNIDIVQNLIKGETTVDFTLAHFVLIAHQHWMVAYNQNNI